MSDKPKLKRVRTVRVITYQGPEKWVDNVLARMITGSTHMGRDQFVIGELLEQREEVVDDDIEPDHHISNFWGTVTDSGLKLHEEMEAKLSIEVKD